jgi:UDP-glucose 4-epimerase
MKILITGCAGLIGSHLSRYLINKNYEVWGIDNLSGGYQDNIPVGLKFIKMDLKNHKELEKIFQNKNFEVVYHIAAYAAEGLSRYILRHNCNSNILSSMNIINASINSGVRKIIFTSSMAVYGKQKVPYTENMIPKPDDPYGASKFFVESILHQSKEHFGLQYSILRPHNVIGIYQNIWDKYRNVLGIWVRNTLNGEPIYIFGDGKQTRAFSDIKFCLDSFEQLIHNYDSDIFNIGSDNFYTIKEAAKIFVEVVKTFGYSVEIIHKETRNEVKHAYCNHNKAKLMLNFIDKTDLKESISNMFRWAKDQPNRKVKKFKYEIKKNMYSSWI